MVSFIYTPFLHPSLKVVLCICYLLFCDTVATADEVSHPYSWLRMEDRQLRQRCGGGIRPWFMCSLDRYDSKKDDPFWKDRGLICIPNIFSLKPSFYLADATQCYSPSIHALLF